MENQEKSIINKSVGKANIATSIVGIIYILIILHDIFTLGIGMSTVELIIGTLIIMGVVWVISFIIVFIIFAVAKGLENDNG